MSSCCGRGRIRSVVSMAQNFTLSVANAISHAIKTKKVMADQSVTTKRIATCKQCEFFSANRCRACGCFIVVKAGLHGDKCPKGFW